MKYLRLVVIIGCLLIVGTAAPADGGGRVKLGYTFVDEEGNEAVNQRTFNSYEGLGLSLERFRYRFDNGTRLSADLKNITLNNRNMTFGLEKSGSYGIRGYNNQFRRTYDFDGGNFTRRHRTGGKLWFYPHRIFRVYGGGEYVNKSGRMEPLFDLAGVTGLQDVDYNQFRWHGGIRGSHRGAMFQAEYHHGEYNDEIDRNRDQSRYKIDLLALLPVPGYERLVLSGRFFHFETKYNSTDFKISTNQVRGGAMAKLLKNLNLNYHFIFDRTSSDSDFIATDNIAHAAYVSYIWPDTGSLTVGYQYGINDDLENEIQSNGIYFYGWLRPWRCWEFRAEHGFNSESVEDGGRLIGDEDRFRFKFTAKCRRLIFGTLSFKFENNNRENEQLGTEVDYIRYCLDASYMSDAYGYLSLGYAYSRGDYINVEDDFEFADHVVYGDISTREYRGFDAGFGAVYYRSKRDLDVESFTLRFRGGYGFMDDYRLDINYNVDNFDDFLVRDKYYTSNIVEISLTKILSF